VTTSFDVLDRQALPHGAVHLLAEIAELRDPSRSAAPSGATLKAWLDQALLENVASSMRMAGLVLSPERLEALVLGKGRPLGRAEEQARAYADALNLIHLSWPRLRIRPATLRLLHRVALAGPADVVDWEERDETDAERSARTIDDLCAAYNEACDRARVPDLALVAALVFDFRHRRPFVDGNDRVARLLLLLGLYQHGHDVGRYVSLDRLIEDEREGWQHGRHDLMPWLDYFLAVVSRAYRVLEGRHLSAVTASNAVLEIP
jgi:hypothetical protein